MATKKPKLVRWGKQRLSRPSLVLSWSWRDVMTASQINVLFNGTTVHKYEPNRGAAIETNVFIKFSGPGMYLTKADSVLVVPQKYQPRPWKRKQHPSVKYDVYVWNGVDISTTINLLANAPVRVDERD